MWVGWHMKKGFKNVVNQVFNWASVVAQTTVGFIGPTAYQALVFQNFPSTACATTDPKLP